MRLPWTPKVSPEALADRAGLVTRATQRLFPTLTPKPERVYLIVAACTGGALGKDLTLTSCEISLREFNGRHRPTLDDAALERVVREAKNENEQIANAARLVSYAIMRAFIESMRWDEELVREEGSRLSWFIQLEEATVPDFARDVEQEIRVGVAIEPGIATMEDDVARALRDLG